MHNDKIGDNTIDMKGDMMQFDATVVKLNAEIATLRAQLAKYELDTSVFGVAHMRKLEAQLTEAKQMEGNRKQEAIDSWVRVREVEAQLKKHGGHTAECLITRLNTPSVRVSCDCGWAEIEQGLG